MNEVRYYTVNEVAELFRKNVGTVRRWARNGKRGAKKIEGQWLFPTEEILK